MTPLTFICRERLAALWGNLQLCRSRLAGERCPLDGTLLDGSDSSRTSIEEELVAGESPDKSVDEGAVGEGRDPRVSVFRPRDPEPEPEAVDPLREAVAAWVASEAGSDSDAEPDSDAESGEAAGAVSGSGSPGRVESKPSADDAEERTAVFRAVKRDSAPAKPAATEEPAESERTAVFRAPKPAEAKPEPEPKPEPSASASAKPASDAGKRDSASVKPAAADQRTTAFGVVKPPATGEPAESERTAVFRAPKPVESKPEPKPESKPEASASAPAKPASDAEKKDSASAKPAAADQRTTAFGVVKPPATGEPADSERTAVFR
ncbi:hypothetical protein ACWGEU_37555, partial [Streptomyces goshikiensis]